MTLPQPAVPSQEVLAHAAYVRGLVRELVFDADLARDVEQETWLAALANEPRDRGALRGWLAVLVRNIAIKAWRSSVRRTTRERASAVREASVPSPTEILEREDLRRRLVEAVLALDEPLRAVLVLRFFEELPPRAVARRLELSVETVRTRTKRGLELLRGRLERESHGGRGAWVLALVRGLKVTASGPQLASILVMTLVMTLVSSVATGVANMKLATKLSASLTAVVLATTTVLWNRGESQEVPRGSAARPSASQAGRGSSSGAPLVPVAVASPETAEGERTAVAPTSGSRESSTATGSVLWRVSWHDGTPAADVAATVHWSAAEDFYADAFEVRTGTDGTCLFELPPTRVAVYPDRPHDVGTIGSAEVRSGEVSEIAITLPRGYDVEGVVVAEDGQPLAGAELFLATNGPSWDGHVVARSDASGGFHIRSISSGLGWLSARAPLREPTLQSVLRGADGTTVAVTLVSPGPGGALEGTVRDGSGQPIPQAHVLVGEDPLPGRVSLPDGSSAWRAPAQRVASGGDGRFQVAGVAAGSVPVQVRAAGFAPWSGTAEIIAGESTALEVALLLEASVEGSVTDAGGLPVSGAEITSRSQGFSGRRTESRADGTFALRGLPAGEFELTIDGEGRGRAGTTLVGTPGALLRWDAVLGGLALRGRVVSPGIEPAQWVIRCESLEWQQAPTLRDASPDAQGAFEFTGLADVSYRIEVIAKGTGSAAYTCPVAAVDGARAGGEDLVIEVDPARWPSARLEGRVLDAHGAPLTDVGISLSCGPLIVPEADGSFEFGPLSPGSYGLAVSRNQALLLRVDPVDLVPNQTYAFGDLIVE